MTVAIHINVLLYQSQVFKYYINVHVFGNPATDYDSLHIFDSTAYYHVNESKLDLSVKKTLFMDITGGVKGYRLWCPVTKKIIFSKYVTFDESAMLKQNIHKRMTKPVVLFSM